MTDEMGSSSLGGGVSGSSSDLLKSRMAAGEFDKIYKAALDDVHGASEDARVERWTTLLSDLEAHSSVLPDIAAHARMDLTVGQVLEHQLHLSEEALEFYLAAQRGGPNLADAFAGARRIFMQQGHYGAAIEMGAIEVGLAEEGHPGLGALLEQLAEVCDGKLGQGTQAYRWASRALKLSSRISMSEIIERRASDGKGLMAEFDAFSRMSKPFEIGARDQQSYWKLPVPGLMQIHNPWVEDALQLILLKDPRNEQARDLLDEFYEHGKRWVELVNYLVKRAKATPRKSSRLEIYKRLAEVTHFGQGDEDASVQWHREVLKLAPVEKGALQYCVNYFSDRDDWNGLVTTYEAALKTRRRGADEAAMLVQIAMLLWRKLDQPERAEQYFRRIKVGQPKHPQMLLFYTEYFEQKGDTKRLMNVLSARQAAAEELVEKVEIGRQLASLAETELGSKDKAIDLWKALLRIEPGLEEAQEELRRLYVQAEKWTALIEVLKGDLKRVPDGDVGASIIILEEMIEIYRDRMNLPVMVANVYTQILELDPSNRSALAALEERFRSASRWNDLLDILDRRAELAREAGHDEEFISIAREAASLLKGRTSGIEKAKDYFEAILELEPQDEEALESLLAIHKRRRDWHSFLDVQERMLVVMMKLRCVTCFWIWPRQQLSS